MKILFITSIPSPYRVNFFNELGKKCDLTVLFEKRISDERDKSWGGYEFVNFQGIILKGKKVSVNTAFCPEVCKYVLDKKYDEIICADCATPTGMLAVLTMKMFHISYYLEADGGMAKSGKGVKERLKKILLRRAKGYFSSSLLCDQYYLTYGGRKEVIYRYPFTSLKEKDIVSTIPSIEEKRKIRKWLKIKESKIIVSVGRFSYKEGKGKGFDLLIEIAEKLDNDVGVYIVGDEPTKEFLDIKKNKKDKLDNLHFLNFKQKEELFLYYKAADLSVLLSRGEAWGLVINEAMANGTPVVVTDSCVGGLELVEDGLNGFLVKTGELDDAYERIYQILYNDKLREKMALRCLDKISEYTLEKMAEEHYNILSRNRRKR